MKSIILLLLIIGTMSVVYGYMKSFYKNEPGKTQIQYIQRSIFNQQFAEEDVSHNFKSMFEDATASII